MAASWHFMTSKTIKNHQTSLKIKGPDNPTSQLLPKMSFNGLSGEREGRKDKDKGRKDKEGSVSVCEVIVFKYVYV